MYDVASNIYKPDDTGEIVSFPLLQMIYSFALAFSFGLVSGS